MSFSLTSAIMGACLVSLAAAHSSAAAEALTIASFGGQYSLSQIEAYHKPFSAKTGIQVNSVDYNGGLAELRAQVESGNVDWDAVDLESQDLQLACNEGLIEKIDRGIIEPGADGSPPDKDFLPGTLHECGVGTAIWSNVVAYNTTSFPGEKPSKIADFFDVQRFPGKRAISKRPNAILEWALIADGVPVTQVYEVLSTPEGVDRAFAKLDTIKPHLIFWEAGAQPPQLLADREVAMSTAYSGRIYPAVVKDKKPLAIIWDAQIWNADSYAIPVGTKNKEAALDFIKFATSPQPLADQAKYIPYAPVRKSSLALIDKAMLPHLPTSPENFKNALQFNADWWSDHADELNERYGVWIAQ